MPASHLARIGGWGTGDRTPGATEVGHDSAVEAMVDYGQWGQEPLDNDACPNMTQFSTTVLRFSIKKY